jgi:hypothetical protein
MDRHEKAFFEKTAQQVISNLKKRRIDASYAETGEQAREEILAMIPDGSSVYRCGSRTLMELGFWDALAAKPDIDMINPFAAGLSPEESMAERIRGFSSDFLVTGTNAITLDGRIINLDRTGNRVAAIAFGPKKVILAVGMNKVSPDMDTAKARVKHKAAPITASMVGAKTPCTADGLCHDCRTPDRLCNAWSIIEGQFIEGRISVKLIGSNFGY